MPCWETICTGHAVRFHPTFSSDHFKCLMLITNLHFSSIVDAPVRRWSTEVVVSALFWCTRLISVAFVWQRKTFRVLRDASRFMCFLWFLYHLLHVDDVCKPNIQKVSYILLKHQPPNPALNSVKTIGCRPHAKCAAKHLKPWSVQFACPCAPMCTPIRFIFYFLSVCCLLKFWC